MASDHTCLLDCGWGCVNETENRVTNKFKAGDRVRLTGKWWPDFGIKLGEVVRIEGVDTAGNAYFHKGGKQLYIFESSEWKAELVTDHQDEYPDSESQPPLDDARWHEGEDEFSFRSLVEEVTSDIASMLIAKNEAYVNSALDPIRTFSKANAREQLLVRIDDKLSRIARGHDFPDEDTIDDLIGYLVLLKIAGNGDD